MIESVLINLSSFFILFFHWFFKVSVVSFFYMPLLYNSLHIISVIIHFIYLLIHQLSVCIMHISQSLLSDISFKLFFLFLPLFILLLIRQFNLIHFSLFCNFFLQYMINMLVHSTLHILFEISEESFILILSINFFFWV